MNTPENQAFNKGLVGIAEKAMALYPPTGEENKIEVGIFAMIVEPSGDERLAEPPEQPHHWDVMVRIPDDDLFTIEINYLEELEAEDIAGMFEIMFDVVCETHGE